MLGVRADIFDLRGVGLSGWYVVVVACARNRPLVQQHPPQLLCTPRPKPITAFRGQSELASILSTDTLTESLARQQIETRVSVNRR